MLYDVIIIGGGPAGISASIYAVSRGLKTLVLEKEAVGGIIKNVSTVTHYSGIVENETGTTFASRLKKQAQDSGVEIRIEDVTSLSLEKSMKQVVTNHNAYEAKAIILANGTSPRHLNIPGEETFQGSCVHYNLANEGKPYEGKEVYVVGGSDGALKEALFLTNIASKVTLIHFEDQLGAISEFVEKAKVNPKLSISLHSRLTKIHGTDHVTKLDITDVHTNKVETIDANDCGIYLFAGSTPNTSLCEAVTLEEGFIVTNDLMETNLPGVFAAGDIRKKAVRQIATAVSDGAIAGIRAAAYVKALS